MDDIYPLSQLYFEQHGSGPKVLFIRGGEEAGGAVAFAEQMPLAQNFTLIWPDLPGHGKSPAKGHKNVERDALIMTELLSEKVHLIGHSYGGAIALRMAALNPGRFYSLTLIEPATLDIAVHEPTVQQMMMEVMTASQIPDMQQRLDALAKAVGIQKTWANKDKLSNSHLQLAQDLPFLKPPSEADSALSQQNAELIAAANIPALVISGGHSPAWETTCDVLAQVLHGERAIIPGHYHQPQRNGEAFNTCVSAFWTSHTV